jgi:hypothetical protein
VINWPDHFGSLLFLNEIIEILANAIIRYAKLVKENNQQLINSLALATSNNGGSHSAQQQHQRSPTKLDAFQKLIISANNMERVRESLRQFLNELDYYNMHATYEKLDKTRTLESNRLQIETLIAYASEQLVQYIEQTLEMVVVNKILIDVDSNLFYLFESPESSPASEVIIHRI